MKLLWQIRGEYLVSLARKDEGEQNAAMNHTFNFLRFLDEEMKSPTKGVL